jgi:hypothetical protein
MQARYRIMNVNELMNLSSYRLSSERTEELMYCGHDVSRYKVLLFCGVGTAQNQKIRTQFSVEGGDTL